MGYSEKQLHHALNELTRLGVEEVPTAILLPSANELAFQWRKANPVRCLLRRTCPLTEMFGGYV